METEGLEIKVANFIPTVENYSLYRGKLYQVTEIKLSNFHPVYTLKKKNGGTSDSKG